MKLRDVLFLCHAKPKDEEQAAIWKMLVDGTLPARHLGSIAVSGAARGTWEDAAEYAGRAGPATNLRTWFRRETSTCLAALGKMNVERITSLHSAAKVVPVGSQ